MRKFYIVSTLTIAILCSSKSFAQDFSNKGKEFWLAYCYHVGMTGGGVPVMTLYLTSDVATTYTVEVYGVTTISSGSIAAGQVIPVTIPNTYFIDNEGTFNGRTIRVTALKPVVVYSYITRSSASGATLCLPTPVLGKEYYSSNFTQLSNEANSNSYFTIIAVEDNTSVEITPSADTKNGWVANTTYTVSLNKGQIYQVLGTTTGNSGTDLTGSKIKSVSSASGGCKRIAVFSGSGKIRIPATGCSQSSSDNLYQQLYPTGSWGKKYLTVPSYNRVNNYYRIIRNDPAAKVYLNGTLIPAASFTSNYYQFFNSIPNLIESDIPVSVLQYFTTQGCDGNGSPYDPDMIALNPVEQNINKVTLVSANLYATPTTTHQHHLHVIMRDGGTGISSFTFDGLAVSPTAWVSHPNETNYKYLYLNNVTQGYHTIASDSGFNALAYGYANAESYGYSAGANVKDLYQYVSVQNQYATVNFPATCRNTPFYFSMTFPYQPTAIQWQFNGLFPDFTMTDPSLFFSGTTVIGGRTLYQYKIPASYSIPNAGTYPIKVVATNPTSDGCGGTQEIDYDIKVFNNPVADFNFNNVCFPDPVQFTDNSNTDGAAVISRYWNFGDISSVTTNNPSHTYSAAGSYSVKYSLITDIGCLADTVQHIVTVSPLPTATVNGTTQVCVNGTAPLITFTGAAGTAPYTFTYNINGGASQIVSTASGNNSATVSVPVTTAGTFTYNLVNVKDASPALCSQLQTGSATVIVNPLPTAIITGTASVCKNAASPIITFTGAAGAAPYLFTYNINGGSNQTVATTVGNSVTIAVPTTTAGTFIYNMVSVQGASAASCSQPQTGSVTITINNLPAASISGTTSVCLNALSPAVTFTGAGASGPYTFSYNINGGVNQTVTTTSGNSVTIMVPTNTPGIFNYNLLNVVDALATVCSQVQSGLATVNVYSLPIPDFSVSTASCETKVLSFTDLSIFNAGNITGWSWNFGDGGTSNLQNPFHTYATAGVYAVTLSVTTDKSCTSNPILSRNVTINPQPVVDFILPEVCLSDAFAQFTDATVIATGSITNRVWNFGDPGSGPLNISSLQNPQHAYSSVGNYTVTLTSTSNTGCITTLSKSFTVNGDIPVANFNALNPAILCANDSVAIRDGSSVNFGSITKLEIYWDNVGSPAVFQTDDFPAPGKIYRHLYPNFQTPLTKIFTIRYRAYSGATCINDKVKTVVVNAAPKIQFNPIPDICLDAIPYKVVQAVEIGAVPGNGIYSGPGISAAGLFTPSVAGAGTHRIKYTFTSTTGGCVDTLSNTIKVFETAVAKFTFSSLACQNSAVDFNSTTSTMPAGNGTITGWNWDFGDPASGAANLSTLQNPSHLFPSWGSYNVKLYISTNNNCKSAVITLPVLVNPVPKPNFTIPVSACLPSASVIFINTSTIADGTQAAFNYLWNFGDPASGTLNTSTGTSPTHIYNSTGPFNVYLQVKTGAGCVHDTTIVLNTIHPQPTGSFTVDKQDVCVGQGISFADNSNPADGTTTQWNWNMGDGTIRTMPSFIYTYNNANAYNVSLYITNSFGCRSSTFTKQVTVNPYPTVNAGPDLFILQDGNDTIQPIITAINPIYLWTPNMYFLSSNTIKSPVVKGVEDITYRITVTGRGGCVASDEVFIKVLKGPEIPNIFSPNGDGVHDTWVIKYLDTYPESTVEIFNRYGQRIFSSVGYGTAWDGTVNGKPVPIGTYYYVVNPKNGRKIMSGYVDIIR